MTQRPPAAAAAGVPDPTWYHEQGPIAHPVGEQVSLVVPTVFEALPLLDLRPRIVGIGRQAYKLRGGRAVLLAGFSGACQADLREGDVVLAGSDAPRLAKAVGGVAGSVRTLSSVASPAEKRRLGLQGALAVDMEGEWLRRAADQLGVPFLAIRVIIDQVTEPAISLRTFLHFPRAAASLRRATSRALELWP